METAMDGMKFLTKENMEKEVCVVVGTRPGIIMLAPVIHELRKKGIPHFVIHTGQHYSPAMDSELFEDLHLTKPSYHLENVNEKLTHGGQTAVMLEGVETALLQRKPSIVLVNGDANTNLAAALAARKLRIAVGHIEAGERSFDWQMPEEHNRRIMDHISELLFATNEKGREQLIKESVMGHIHVTGNTIVDASLNHAKLAEMKSDVLESLDVSPGKFILMTAHREENADDKTRLWNILLGASRAGETLSLPVIFLAHPRTKKRIFQFGLEGRSESLPFLRILESMRYLDFMQLLTSARAVMTDSGGVQQEAYIHQKPCVTLRDNTEWTETLNNGANRLAGASDPEQITNKVCEAIAMGSIESEPIFGDGRASERIVSITKNFMEMAEGRRR
jgi:UDP-N-acetylglucosamine 2-epimerase (non-hydrolysing)